MQQNPYIVGSSYGTYKLYYADANAHPIILFNEVIEAVISPFATEIPDVLEPEQIGNNIPGFHIKQGSAYTIGQLDKSNLTAIPEWQLPFGFVVIDHITTNFKTTPIAIFTDLSDAHRAVNHLVYADLLMKGLLTIKIRWGNSLSSDVSSLLKIATSSQVIPNSETIAYAHIIRKLWRCIQNNPITEAIQNTNAQPIVKSVTVENAYQIVYDTHSLNPARTPDSFDLCCMANGFISTSETQPKIITRF